MYNVLPLLLQDPEIVLLRPSNSSTDPRLNGQFIHDTRVRRQAASQWLDFLRAHHLEYRDIIINDEAIEQLPVDSSVAGDIPFDEGEADMWI